jgi:hypothetical protein
VPVVDHVEDVFPPPLQALMANIRPWDRGAPEHVDLHARIDKLQGQLASLVQALVVAAKRLGVAFRQFVPSVPGVLLGRA